jgi:prepilin-type processing-associated H-X9-DG protein
MTPPFLVAGLGTALPELSIAQTEAEARAASTSSFSPEQQRTLRVLYRTSGVSTRHSVLLERGTEAEPIRQSFYPPRVDETDGGPTTATRMRRYVAEAPHLAERAARAALDQAQLAPASISHLVTVSCTGFGAPGFDLDLIERLGLDRGVSRTHVGFMGCHGALNGLRVARSLAANDPGAAVLVAAVELCSLHHQYGWHPERLVANALFADGAAAVVGVCQPESDPAAWRLRASGSQIVANTTDLMSWHVADHGFEMTLSAKVPAVIESALRPWMEAWLAREGTSLANILSWAVHPGGPRILASVQTALGLPPDALDPSRRILASHGNMSSPTVLFILEQLRQSNTPRPCVALGFGPGLAIEAALFD